MTAQDLKNSILQLAMQGKLVEQRAEEGTARELIEQIGIEKERLIKEGKIRKEKPLPKITEEETPFEIPESWEWVRLANVCIYLQRGKSPKYSDIKKIPVIAQKCNQWDSFQLEKAQFIVPETLEKYPEERILQDKDVLINSTGLGTVGRNQIYLASDNPYGIAVADSHVTVVRLDSRIITPEFFFYYWRNPSVQLVIEDQTSGSTKQKELALTTIQNYPVPIPPLTEQKRIVAKIKESFPYVEQYDKAYTKLELFNQKFSEDIQRSILQYAMQGKLVEQKPEEGTGEELYRQIHAEKEKLIKVGKFKKEKRLSPILEEEIPFDIPASWKWVRLGEIILFQGGYAFKSDAYVEKSDNQVVRLGNVKKNKLLIHEKEVFIPDKLAEQAAAYKIRENDILVSMTGTRRKKDYFYTVLVGKNDVSEKNLYLNQRVGCFRAIDGIYHKYLLFALQNEIIKDIIFMKETGTANQGNLGSEDMKQFVYIPLPPYEEQKRIVEELEKIIPYCQRLIK